MVKYCLILAIRFLTKILYILPIKKNRILFYSFSGKKYTCSPKYIYEYININYNKDFEMIWALNKPNDYPNLKCVKYGSLKHLIIEATSKFIITNTGPFKAVSSRKGQIIINTWHGGGAYKKTGMDNPYKNKYQYLYNKNLGQNGVNLFLSSSNFFTKYAIRNAFGYKGEVLEYGLPRNDQLFNKNKIKENMIKVKKFYNLDESVKILLYAPTWRNYDMYKYEKIEIANLLKVCKERFGGNWIFLYRGHNFTNNVNINEENTYINATDYPEMQELLSAADLLISDYSSCIWDYSLLYRPTILFTPDIEMYDQKFAFYTAIDSWGFKRANTNKELFNIIKNLNLKECINMINNNHEYFGNKETGNSTKKVVDYILKNV